MHHGKRNTFPTHAHIGDTCENQQGIRYTYVERGKLTPPAWMPDTDNGPIFFDGVIAPLRPTLGQCWTHPLTSKRYIFAYDDKNNEAWIIDKITQPFTPPERDVPHWAVSNVAAMRIANDLPAIVTDRMIFAAMLNYDSDVPTGQGVTVLKEWAERNTALSDIPSDRAWWPFNRQFMDTSFRPARRIEKNSEFHKEWSHRYGEFPTYNAPSALSEGPEAIIPLNRKPIVMNNLLHDEAKRNAINGITRQSVDDFRKACEQTATARNSTNMLDYYQTIATKSAIYPGQGTPLGLAYVALKLNGEAGEFAEHVGKAMRDDKYIENDNNKCLKIEMQYPFRLGKDVTVNKYAQLTPDRRALIIKEIGDVLWYLSAACNELGIKLSDAATTNLEKLCDRTERDALRGSGDER